MTRLRLTWLVNTVNKNSRARRTFIFFVLFVHLCVADSAKTAAVPHSAGAAPSRRWGAIRPTTILTGESTAPPQDCPLGLLLSNAKSQHRCIVIRQMEVWRPLYIRSVVPQKRSPSKIWSMPNCTNKGISAQVYGLLSKFIAAYLFTHLRDT